MHGKRVSVIAGRVDLTVTANTLQAVTSGGAQTFNSPEDVTIDAQTIADGLGFPPTLTFSVQRNINYNPISVTISGPPWEGTFTNLAPGVDHVTVSGTDTNGVQQFLVSHQHSSEAAE